jgi:hypothetical protein
MEYDIVYEGLKYKYYYIKGTKILHREDGPAIETMMSEDAWYWHGEYAEDVDSRAEFEAWKKLKNF